MRVFKNKSFARFVRKSRITDAILCAAISDASRGLIDADLGGGVVKQRVARQGSGKSGGFRTIILFRLHERAFFVHGFAKNEQDNIRDDELAAFNRLRKFAFPNRHRDDSIDAIAFGSGRGMRGADVQTAAMFSYVSPEALVPEKHPLREIRPLVNAALGRLSRDFDQIYAPSGRDSIAPEKLLRALLLQAFFSVRSERQLMEQITYNMMFRWFIGLSMDAPVWDVTVFTKNRERLLRGDIARGFLAAILVDPQVKPLLSDEHFSVDGTLIDAWASMKSFQPKDGSGDPPAPGRNGERDYRGETRSNATHGSTSDPDARLFKKAAGQASRLCHMGHVLMENRNGLVVDAELTHATGTAEREAAQTMVGRRGRCHRVTLGGDKAYDTSDFVAEMRRLGVTPHVSQNTKGRRSAIDGRTTRHAGYAISVRVRKRIEEVFGWMKSSAGFRKTRHRGTARVGWLFTLNAAAYNLVRLSKLLASAA